MSCKQLRFRILYISALLAILVSVCGCDVLFTKDPTHLETSNVSSVTDAVTKTDAPDKSITEETAESTRSQADPEESSLPTEADATKSSINASAEETTAIYIEIETPDSTDEGATNAESTDNVYSSEDISRDPDETEDVTWDVVRPTGSSTGIISDPYPAGLHRTVTNPFIVLDEAKYAAATQYNYSANNYRMAQVIKKAQAGKPVTIGLIGGSITQGTGTYWEGTSYAQILEGFWRGYFPNSALTFINAGIGGTDSYIGVHRVSGLLAADPDLVIIEFSVNDAGSSMYQTYYENLVRRVKAAPSAPAVLLLFMTTNTGTDASPFEIPIGRKYSVPMISYRDALLPAISAREFKWTDIAVDFIHPNVHGHSFAARLIIHYLLTTIDAVNAGNYQTSDVPVPSHATAYANAEIYDSRVLKPVSCIGFSEGSNASENFKYGWSTSSFHEEAKAEPAPETRAASSGISAAKMNTLLSGAGSAGIYHLIKTNKADVIYLDKDTVIKTEPTTASATKQTQPATTAAQKSTEAPTKPDATSVPTTPASTTPAPTTADPTKPEPTTAAPTKPEPTTAAPTKPEPTTTAPTKPEPTTVAPTKPEPTTAAPTTAEPTAAESTEQPTGPAPVQEAHEITFTVNARNIGFLFRVFRDGSGQVMQVFIDGKFVGVLNGNGIDEANTYDKGLELYTSGSSREHTITIKIDPASGGSRFALEGLLLS